MFKHTPTLLCDFYKISHRVQYPEGTTLVYSNLTPRSNKYYKGKLDKVIFFGLQYFIKHVLIDMFNESFFQRPKEEVIKEYRRVIKHCLFVDHPDTTHIEALHNLGYLPLSIQALPEGSLVNYQVPVLTIYNTHPDFFWLTNFVETVMSSDLWLMSNNATIAYEYKLICKKYAEKTCDNSEHLPFQCHDFSFRGMAGHEAATMSGMAHLLSFKGTDTVPAINALEYYYNANIETELVGCSIPASEHSVMCAGGQDSEFETYKRFITELYPNGLVSIVSDTWDFFGVLTDILPKLKNEIMARNGKVVIRPDSGDPVDIICGEDKIILVEDDITLDDSHVHFLYYDTHTPEEYPLDMRVFENPSKYLYNKNGKYFTVHASRIAYSTSDDGICFTLGNEAIFTPQTQAGAIQLLWKTFGGTINEKGYKVLDSHIGLIYGDSITLDRAEEIFKRLEAKGFASSNVVFGVGSHSYQYNTRDSQGWAVKATYCEVNGEGRAIYKTPKTDSGKNSAKGLLRVEKNGDDYILFDNQTVCESLDGELQLVFFEDVISSTNLETIRNTLDKLII